VHDERVGRQVNDGRYSHVDRCWDESQLGDRHASEPARQLLKSLWRSLLDSGNANPPSTSTRPTERSQADPSIAVALLSSPRT
jgi:hypothetical protein